MTQPTPSGPTVEVRAKPLLCLFCGTPAPLPLAGTEYICQTCAIEGIKWAVRQSKLNPFPLADEQTRRPWWRRWFGG